MTRPYSRDRDNQLKAVPEVDRAEWFTVDEARAKINPAQVALLDRLLDAVVVA